jgi:Tfp pilus assembly protein PilF
MLTMTRPERSACRWAALALVVALLWPNAATAAPGVSTVREYRKVIRTYPFSDPNPVPVVGRIYPYFRFDGYTDTPVEREWTVVELENDYLRVTVLPEIGGKIWSAVEKSTGRSFIYDNHVVKFRDIAMRGPWTSGGIEPNYGIIGHTPNCATPVDYATSSGAFGARVVIGVLDLLTRTPWSIEITLPSDAAYFTTRSLWFNATSLEQPYYTWMNTGIKAAGNLELIYPGTHYIGHGGEVSPWPIHPENGKNLAFYEQNDFGPYKSYHVLGRGTDFFGAYWHDDDFGMGRYSTRDDKLGKKAWIWGLSRQGMIWEKLLTDTDGQYVEVQSGRLFNQAAEASTFTPFKHRGFEPHSSDTWTEYWFPVKGTGGFVDATPRAVLNVILPGSLRPGATAKAPMVKARALEIRVAALTAIDDALEVLDGDRTVFTTPLRLAPAATWARTLEADVPAERLRVRIGTWLDYRAVAHDELSRPLESPKDFDWTSAQGLWLTGKEWIRQRDYVQAQDALDACLKKDPHYLPALADLAMVRYRALDYQGAWDLARRGLAIDTYDPASNYYYALAAVRLGRTVDALDGFEVAASSPAYRAAALVEMAKVRVRRGAFADASRDVERSLESGPSNLDALQLRAVLARLSGAAAPAAADALAAAAPLNHLARFERYLSRRSDADLRAFLDGIRNEMPQETFLELAAWYHDLGRADETRELLRLAPQTGEVLYWLAYVQQQAHDPAAADTLRLADAASPRLVFPFRAESAPVFEWAVRQSSNWRPKYYLALILWSRNETGRARDLLTTCGSAPDYAPFYVARAKALEPVARDASLADLRHAAALDPGEWRYGKALAERLIADRALPDALDIAARYSRALPQNYILGMLHARTLLLNDRVAEAAARLDTLSVLPFEGSTEGRTLHREAQLRLAAQAFLGGDTAGAARRVAGAREWPERLGAGKPYPDDVDERVEDWMAAQCLARAGKAAESRTAFAALAASTKSPGSVGHLLAARALAVTGRQAEADAALKAWADRQNDPRIVAWGRQVVAGGPAPWPSGVLSNEEHRAVSAWLAERK